VYQKWVDRVCEEFFAQGDAQKELGLPVSQMCDRDVTEVPKMQMGFITFVIAPFFKELFRLFPAGLKPLAINLRTNYEFYAHKHASDHSELTEDEDRAVREGIVKLDDSLAEVYGKAFWMEHRQPKTQKDSSWI